jgi:hypothetical protein
MGQILIAWSARIAVLFYLVRIGIELSAKSSPRREFWSRCVWTAACAVYLLHVVFAFHFAFGWSHAAAVAHASRRTLEIVGLDWPGAMWINYVFTVLWVSDVALWWKRARRNQATPPAVYWSVHVLFAFIVFNATVVFGPPFWKSVFPIALVLMVAARILLPWASDLSRTTRNV